MKSSRETDAASVVVVSVRPRTKRRSRGERAWTHAQPRSDGRWNGLQRAAAAWTEFETCVGAGKMGAEPVAASGTLLINALHGPAGQILHASVLHFCRLPPRGSPSGLMNFNGAHCAAAGL
jgi:hypothetical protein